jgi:5'-nucleotidase/UDP-sugar diphosphatase
MGNLVADAVLDRVKNQGITISILGGGGLRASIKSGTITMGDVLTVMPFQNSIATFKMRGSDIREALENGASKIEETAGRFAQVAGLRYTFDPSLPAGKRIIDVDVKEGNGFVPIDPNKTYGVVTNNYMRAGGDGYDVFADKAENAYDFGPSLEEAVAAYLTANSPYTPVIDGRIKLAASAGTAPEAPAPTASTAAPAASTTTTTSGYVIQRGDSLWKIAAEKLGDGHRWTSIAKENDLKQPNHIFPGNELTIPAQ